jgi:hypothetical protein
MTVASFWLTAGDAGWIKARDLAGCHMEDSQRAQMVHFGKRIFSINTPTRRKVAARRDFAVSRGL